jgi:hypothetical protein
MCREGDDRLKKISSNDIHLEKEKKNAPHTQKTIYGGTHPKKKKKKTNNKNLNIFRRLSHLDPHPNTFDPLVEYKKKLFSFIIIIF